MDIEESKELLKKELANTYSEKKAKAIKVVLSELDKKDKIINDMSEQLITPVHSKKWVIDYFTNKVEEDK